MRALGLLILAGCEAAPPAAGPLLAGAAQADITPPGAYFMSGYYHERKNTGVRDPLQAKALAFRQGEVRAALVVVDVCSVSSELSTEVRRRAAARTGIPAAHLAVAATHTHTGPDYSKDLRAWLAAGGKDPDAYPARLIAGIVDALARADAEAAPLDLQVGAAAQETPISFCRRFHMKDGGVRTWANYKSPDTLRETAAVDPEVAVLALRDARSPLALLVNFALHLDTLGGSLYSADFPHDMTVSLRRELGPRLIGIFANGCCGDLNHVNPRADQRNPTDFIGESLAATVKAAPLAPLASPSLAVRRKVVDVPLQEASDADLAWARDLVAQDRDGKKLPFLDEVKAYKLLEVERLRKSKGPSLPLEVQAIRLGADAAIVTLPGEVFVDLGRAIKKASPFRRTFVIELANADETFYIPTREQYALGGYETTNSTVAPGGGELLAGAAIDLLRELGTTR